MDTWPPEVAPTLTADFGDKLGQNNQHIDSQKGGMFVPSQVFENHGTDSRVKPVNVCPTVTSRWGTGGNNVPLSMQPTYAIQGSMIGRNDNAGPQGDGINVEVCFTQNTIDRHAVAQPFQQIADCLTSAYGTKWNGNASATNGSLFAAQPILGGWDYENNAHGPDDVTGPLLKGSPTGGGRPLPAIALQSMAVRRLTPTECERLQGFPDGYTNIPWRKASEAPDGPRYKALGNSWAVPVVRWIGKRIQDQIK